MHCMSDSKHFYRSLADSFLSEELTKSKPGPLTVVLRDKVSSQEPGLKRLASQLQTDSGLTESDRAGDNGIYSDLVAHDLFRLLCCLAVRHAAIIATAVFAANRVLCT